MDRKNLLISFLSDTLVCPQVIESGWMEWGKNDKIPSINLKDLENLFGVDKDKDKKATPSETTCIALQVLYYPSSAF